MNQVGYAEVAANAAAGIVSLAAAPAATKAQLLAFDSGVRALAAAATGDKEDVAVAPTFGLSRQRARELAMSCTVGDAIASSGWSQAERAVFLRDMLQPLLVEAAAPSDLRRWLVRHVEK